MGMKFFVAVFFIVLVVFFGFQGYRLFVQRNDYLQKTAAINAQADALASENAGINDDIRFYRDPRNATKELQSKLNYREPQEQMIILVPPQAP